MYSIRDHLSQKCKDEYSIDQLDDIAFDIVQNSKNHNLSYNQKGALSAICKYAKVKGTTITFDVQNRDSAKTYDTIKNTIENNQSIKKNIGKSSSKKSDKKSDKKTEKKTKKDKKDDKKDDKKPVKKGGFGKFIVVSDENANQEEDTKIDKTENKKENKKEDKPKKRKGGFGIFTKVLTDSPSFGSDEEYDPNHKYLLPAEPHFEGVYKSSDKYAPFGTDNFHDHVIKNDKLNSEEKRRASIYAKLASIEYPPQRSEKWFKMRDQMITASDGGTIVSLNPYEEPYSFVLKKVHGKPFDTSIDCYHGKKYEQVATMVYEYRMNVKVEEFGLCQHPKHKFLGASPDGIVSPYKLDGKHKTKYVGRMLEIKCPMRRKILMDSNAPEVYGPHGEKITDLKKDVKRGVCPAYYWVQVQLQLECCDLDECDFWQCDISEYSSREEFINDTDPVHPWLSRKTHREKGVVIQLLPKNIIGEKNNVMDYDKRIWNFADFIYLPRINMTPYEIDTWIAKTVQNLHITHPDFVLERILYWKVRETRNITIKRDCEWFEKNLPIFATSWSYIEYFRRNQELSDILWDFVTLRPKYDYGKKITQNYPNEIMDLFSKLCTDDPANFNIKNDTITYIKKDIDSNKKTAKKSQTEHNQLDVSEYIDQINELLTKKYKEMNKGDVNSLVNEQNTLHIKLQNICDDFITKHKK